MGAAQRRRAEDRIRSGEAALVVGTHALLTESVDFTRLGLAIIDEQHRFGVMQRAALRAKGRAPHTLHMTATPIPRTLAQTRYADLDVSKIDEIPPNRSPVETFVLRASRKDRAYELLAKIVAGGGQAYIVAPAIGGEQTGAESGAEIARAVEEFAALRQGPLRGVRTGLMHGRLPAREKDAVMQQFVRGEMDVLVATTVVEVGVDVPNASAMVVLDAHRYGLAQLHQLRGRVGRGAARSYCMLIEPDDCPGSARLEVLESTTDGFAIADADLACAAKGSSPEPCSPERGERSPGRSGKRLRPVRTRKGRCGSHRQGRSRAYPAPNIGPWRAFLREELAERAVAVSS